jgi:hypothetical protein
MHMATNRNALVCFDGLIDPLAPPRGEREELIQKCAYFKALKRRLAPGHELNDWLAAEKEVDEWLRLLQTN